MRNSPWSLIALVIMLWPAAARADDEALRGKVKDRVAQLRLQALVETVGADPETARRVQGAWHGAQMKIRPVRKQVQAMLQDLAQAAAQPSPDEARIRDLSDRVIELRRQIRDLEDARQQEVRHILSPTQFAKLLTGWPEAERRIRERLRRAAESE
jgi:hypothetical protein